MTVVDYTYEENSRRPVTLFATVVGVAMLAVAAAYDAPWFFVTPVLVAFLMCLWAIVSNRKSGMMLVGDELRLYAGRWSQTVLASRIRSAKITHWTDGAPSVTLKLADGTSVPIPGYCIGSAAQFTQALRGRGIAIV